MSHDLTPQEIEVVKKIKKHIGQSVKQADVKNETVEIVKKIQLLSKEGLSEEEIVDKLKDNVDKMLLDTPVQTIQDYIETK